LLKKGGGKSRRRRPAKTSAYNTQTNAIYIKTKPTRPTVSDVYKIYDFHSWTFFLY